MAGKMRFSGNETRVPGARKRDWVQSKDRYYTTYESEDLFQLAATHEVSFRRYTRICRELGTRLQRVKHWRCTKEAREAGFAAVDASYHLMKLAEALDALKEKLGQEFTEDHAG